MSQLQSSLIFPEAINSFKADRGAIRAGLRDTFNRLHSILEDATFIERSVAPAFPYFPLIANQRAGAWYVRPKPESHYAYFKSTDGHTGEHNFNLRRANLSLVPLLNKYEGIVLVDSTRRGKLAEDDGIERVDDLESWQENGKLWTLPSAVGRFEHAQIQAKINHWAQELVASSYNLDELRKLKKPLRPLFVTPASQLSAQSQAVPRDFHPVVCVSASKLAADEDGLERASGFTYVQGSGDDHEEWSKGLTPSIFWKHSDRIFSASRVEIDDVIVDILRETSTSSEQTLDEYQIRDTNIRLVFDQPACHTTDDDPCSVVISTQKVVPAPDATAARHIVCKPGKAGHTSFFKAIGPALQVAGKRLQEGADFTVIAAQTETSGDTKDLIVAFAVCLLTRHFDDDGKLSASQIDVKPNKATIRARLQWILESVEGLNPSRNVLTRLNEYLISNRV
ncbi:tRNA A64-2'-O-ribosylphosphate transferase [Microbotryomycetes sp. JL221]|nr:tRNA A64-2'-O-ribosylphosphate transferase [Microbotryomycetes sp. JL221]